MNQSTALPDSKPLVEGPRTALAGKKPHLIAASIAALATLLFYLQALVGGSLDAGFVYTGDFWNQLLPLAAKMNSLVLHGAFSGIDFSTHGGASEIFLRPNENCYHPLMLLYSMVSHSGAPQRLMRFWVLLIALHSFIGCYFTVLLGTRFLKLTTALAAFIAVGYNFSILMVYALGYPPFLFCATLLPWSIYGGLAIAERPSLRRIVIHSTPIFVTYTAGYVAIALSCVIISWLFLAAYIIYVDSASETLRIRLGRLTVATSPFALATVVAAPLYWAMFQYFHVVHSSSSVSLFFSAHQLSEQPRTILRLLSSRLYYAGPLYEYTLVWGLIPVIICVLFFAGFRDAAELSDKEWRLFKITATLYALIVLAIYGDYSAVSDLLYYVPFVGSMHIYQRQLLAGHLFLMIPVALMLKAVAGRKPGMSAKIVLFASAALLAASAHLLAVNSPNAVASHLNDFLVFELLLAVLFVASLFVPGATFSCVIGTALMFLLPLDHIYDFSTAPSNKYETHRQKEVVLNETLNAQVLSYFRSHSNKAIIKYVDVTPGAPSVGSFSRNYPWFVAMDLPLCSYGGYDFLLAQRVDYGRRMVFTAPENQWIMRPDWKYVARTGGEFIVFQEKFRLNDPHLHEVADTGDPAKVLHLPNNLVIAPLRAPAEPGFGVKVVKGRYVRVQLPGSNYLSLAEVRVMATVDGASVNLAQGKVASQSSTVAGALGGPGSAVDGNTDGAFPAGSVTHTNLDADAWWQVDLRKSAAIESIEIWNRTDGASNRLGEYWVFVSEKPFGPSDTPATLQGRQGVLSCHQTTMPNPSTVIVASKPEVLERHEEALFDNGYLRVVGLKNAAVVKGFQTDGASELMLDVEVDKPVKVEYLFWPNERLKYQLSGRPVSTRIEDGLETVSVPVGRHRLEIKYEYGPLRVFLLFYFLYTLSVIGASLTPFVRAGWTRMRLGAKI